MVKGQRVIGYVRVSTAEQADSGLGMEAQRTAIRAECDRRGWVLERIYEDAGFSAKSMVKRAGLGEALTALRAGEADGLVVAKLDRLSRSLKDFANVMTSAHSERWTLVVLDMGVDTTTPSGELMANVMASFAQFERQIIGQRTRDALAVKKAQGVRLGRPRQLPQQVVDRVVSASATGRSLRSIAEELNGEQVQTAQGGARWYASTVRAVLASNALD
jgi:DNA invertase Pin-like site-specific DNA recombinase